VTITLVADYSTTPWQDGIFRRDSLAIEANEEGTLFCLFGGRHEGYSGAIWSAFVSCGRIEQEAESHVVS
jgi:hypothetical protein